MGDVDIVILHDLEQREAYNEHEYNAKNKVPGDMPLHVYDLAEKRTIVGFR